MNIFQNRPSIFKQIRYYRPTELCLHLLQQRNKIFQMFCFIRATDTLRLHRGSVHRGRSTFPTVCGVWGMSCHDSPPRDIICLIVAKLKYNLFTNN